ncbi:MAG TPA: chloramphenicol acetyltransferase [Methylococcaceae bacterium]|nr:chloramphenicol acetyltransferase [Methylococcaceae bacterium]
MRKVDLDLYQRRALFEAFKDRDVPYFSTTSLVDITPFHAWVKEQQCGFFVPFSFLISTAVNRISELRQRIVGGELYEFDIVDPGYTVLLEDNTFSFCDARHFNDFGAYLEHANAKIAEVKQCPDRSVGEKYHMFFITSLPWFSFTSVTHPYDRQYGSIPIVTIGKYFAQGNQLLIPIGIQVHHAVVDGIHVGRFYQHLSSLCQEPTTWLK